MMWNEQPGNGAIISQDQKYRYALWRKWDPPPMTPAEEVVLARAKEFVPGPWPKAAPRWCVFCMLNPSTADHEKDDATIRKLISYARKWSYSRLLVVNVFAYRATDPGELWKVPDPVGPGNQEWVHQACNGADLVVCGWGRHADSKGAYGQEMLHRMKTWCRPSYLKLNQDGSPQHPLYLKGDLEPKAWS